MNSNGKYTQQSSYSSRSGITWSSTSSYSLNTKLCTNIIVTSKSTEITKNVASVEDSFLCFISDQMLKKILLHTNIQGNENGTSDHKFEEITMINLKGFIGLLIPAGLLGKSRKSIRSFWSMSPLESPIFRARMSRNRFEMITSCLRFNDKATRDERKQTDKFAAIREIWSDSETT